MTTELATIDGEIIEEHPHAPLTLFGTDNPAEVVARASAVATALDDVIRRRNLIARIGGREHLMLEAWTLLGSMLGVFGNIEWTRQIERGWEARAVARTMSGAIVGSAEAMCTRDERTWLSRDEYAIRSMAQTRALSKALRLPLGFIAELAGFAATPVEELPAEHDEPPQHGRQTVPLEELQARLQAAAAQKGIGPSVVDALAQKVYGKPFAELRDELVPFGRDIVAGKYDAPFESASDGRVSDATSQESEPAQVAAGGSSDTTPPANEQPAVERAHTPAGDAPEAGVSPPPASGAATAQRSDSPASQSDGADMGDGDTAAPSGDLIQQVLDVTGGTELVEPPKPGTDQYRALSAYEKSQARAYWANAEPKGARETHEPEPIGMGMEA